MKDGKVSKEAPIILATRGNGIVCKSGKLCFYEGLVKATGSVIVGTITEQPLGYNLVNEIEVIDGKNYNVVYLSK